MCSWQVSLVKTSSRQVVQLQRRLRWKLDHPKQISASYRVLSTMSLEKKLLLLGVTSPQLLCAALPASSETCCLSRCCQHAVPYAQCLHDTRSKMTMSFAAPQCSNLHRLRFWAAFGIRTPATASIKQTDAWGSSSNHAALLLHARCHQDAAKSLSSQDRKS